MLRKAQLIIGLILSFVVFSCGGSDADHHQVPPQQWQNVPRPPAPTPREDPNIVRDVNAIIKRVKEPLKDFKEFRRSGANPRGAYIVLLGENHVDERGLIDQLRALLKLAKQGDIILLEGNAPITGGWQNCDSLVFRIYATQRWNETHSLYSPEGHFDLQRALTPSWKKNKAALKLKSLKLDQFACNFWDAHHGGPTTYTSLRERNRSLVTEVFKYMGQGRNIFVLAGYAHLPMGDLHEFKRYLLPRVPDAKRLFNLPSSNAIIKLTPRDFYMRLRFLQDEAAEVRERLGFGSTEDVYDFLKNTNYSELIPQYLLAHPDLCGEECD